jgi:PIN domain nuclease of toxin-antitoxin system
VRVLVDTCAFVWLAVDDAQLTEPARKAMGPLETQCFVSAISALEIATKVRLGKWREAEYLAANLALVIRDLQFTELPVTVEHGQRAGMLPGPHKDPFDRMLIAQAQAENLPIVSNDRIFDEYRIRRIW